MTGYNLPPGVTESMIPGNRPEDARDEQILEDLWGVLMQHGYSPPAKWEDEDALDSDLLDVVLKYADPA